MASILAGLGYPKLQITVGDDGQEMPDQVNAGRILIVYENMSEEPLHLLMLRLPTTIPVDQAIANVGPEALEPPAWSLEADFPGFVGETMPGQTTYAVVDLMPGSHLVLHYSATALKVVNAGATPVTGQTPPADGTVNLFEMGFEFPEVINPGQQVREVTSVGEVSHELLLVQSAEPVTAEQIIELFGAEDENATPVGGGPSLATSSRSVVSDGSLRERPYGPN